jgi:hypothetical protein
MKYGWNISSSFFPQKKKLYKKEDQTNMMHNEPSIKALFNSVLNYGWIKDHDWFPKGIKATVSLSPNTFVWLWLKRKIDTIFKKVLFGLQGFRNSCCGWGEMQQRQRQYAYSYATPASRAILNWWGTITQGNGSLLISQAPTHDWYL